MQQKKYVVAGFVGLIALITIFFVFHFFIQHRHQSVSTIGKESHVYQQDQRIYRQGDRGGYVWELQNRLKFLGFYTGPVNGIFTERTTKAVRLFQYEFGLKIDGIVGAKTKEKLWRATRHWRPEQQDQPVRAAHGISQQDFQLIAQTVHAEARGEPYIGQVAVAAVILNRLKDERFPNTPSAVIYKPLALTAVADGQSG